MSNDLELVRQGIDELIKGVEANPLTYFGESDLQSELFAVLLNSFGDKERIGNVFVWGTDDPKPLAPCLSRRLHSELLLPEGRIDIAILDLSKVRVGINSKGRFGYVQLEPGEHIFIEIKASRTNRSSVGSKNQWIQLIREDIERLSAYSHLGIVLCFDFNKLLNENEVIDLTRFTPQNVQLRYVQDHQGDCYLAQGLA